MPITWRNINAPDFTGVARIMDSGGDALTAGLDKLTQTVQGIGQTNADNWDVRKQNNSDALLTRIAAARNMDEYNALQSEVPGMLDHYGAQVDRKAVMESLLGRKTAIQEGAMQDAKFADFETQQQWNPFSTQVKSLIAANKHDEALNLLNSTDAPGSVTASLYQALEADRQSDSRYDSEMLRNRLAAQQAQQGISQSATRFGWEKEKENRLSQERLVSDYAASRALAGKPMDEGLTDFFGFVGGLENVSPTAITNGLTNMVNTYSSLVGDSSPFAQKENEQFTRSFTETPVKELGIYVPENGYFKESDSYVTALQKVQKGRESVEAQLNGLPEYAKPGGASTYRTLDRVALEMGGKELPSDISGQEGWIANFISSQSPGMRIAPKDANKLRNVLMDATGGTVSSFNELPYELVEEFLVKVSTNARTTDNELKIDDKVTNMAARQVFGNFKQLTNRGKELYTEAERLRSIEAGFQQHQLDSTNQFKEKRERERLRQLARSRNQ